MCTNFAFQVMFYRAIGNVAFEIGIHAMVILFGHLLSRIVLIASASIIFVKYFEI